MVEMVEMMMHMGLPNGQKMPFNLREMPNFEQELFSSDALPTQLPMPKVKEFVTRMNSDLRMIDFHETALFRPGDYYSQNEHSALKRYHCNGEGLIGTPTGTVKFNDGS
eukprot:gene19621-6803_t